MNLDELKAELNKPKSWIVEVYWWCYRFWHNQVKTLPKETKWFFQRGYRGYADCDVWSMDGYLTDIIPAMIRRLMTYKNSYPPEFQNIEEWLQILDEIASGFELMKAWEEDYAAVLGDSTYVNFKNPVWKAKLEAKEKEVYEKFEKAKELFCKWYGHLWD